MSATREAGVSAALLLARWWSRPTADEMESWAGLWPQAHETVRALELGDDGVAELQAALTASQSETLLDEYEGLLVGPGRPPCGPYESLWRTDQPQHDQGILMSSAADAVMTVYRDLDLQLRTDAHELPDHLLVEWEALAYALDTDAADVSDELLRGHLAVWMAPFCSAVSGETEQPFYAALARLTPAWTAAIAG